MLRPRVLRLRPAPFAFFVAASASANLADGIRAVALPLLAVALTRDPSLVAGLLIAQSLPALIAGLPAGVLADRVDRRRLLLATNGIESALFGIVAGSVLLDLTSVPLLYVAAFSLGSNETLRDTAMSTAVPALVPPAQLERANGRLVSVGFVGNQLAGPALGAALFALALASPFAFSAVLVAGAGLLISTLPSLNRSQRRSGTESAEPAEAVIPGTRLRAFARDVVEGVLVLLRHPILRTIALLAVVLHFTDAAWFSILVLLLTDEIGLPEWAYGAVLAIAALGGAVGGWVAHHFIERLGAASVLRGGLVVIAAAQIAIGLAREPVVATAGIALGNAAIAVWLAAAASQRHRLTSDEVLGRVTAAWRTAALGAIPAGALAGGALASMVGLRAPFLAGAPLLLVAALLARPVTARAIEAARTDGAPRPRGES